MTNSEEIKSRGHKTIDEIDKASVCVVIVSDTNRISTSITGEAKEIVGTLATVMASNEDFRRICGIAYTLSDVKQN